MTIQEIMNLTGATPLTKDVDMNREVTCGYACDMLSWVMSHAKAGMAWITVQSHMNVVAVASMMEMSAVILPEGIDMFDEAVTKANDEGVAVLKSKKTAYELSGLLYQAGVSAQGAE